MSLTFYNNTDNSDTDFGTNILINQELSFSDAYIERETIDQSLINCVFDQKKETQLSHENIFIAPWLVYEKTETMIFEQLFFPLEWEKEKVSRPNLVSKNMAMEVCKSLFDTYSLIPYKISPTKEEGVYIRFDYRSGKVKRSLIIEVYNTLEIAAIITNNDIKDVDLYYDIEKLQFKNAIQHLKKIN